jgi:hypothetical protein
MTTVVRASGMSEFLSIVPYLLGFTPSESIVILGLSDRRVVLTARVDIDPSDMAQAGLLVAKRSDAMIVVVYTEQPVPAWLGLPPCDDALLVTGGRWRSLLRDDPPDGGKPIPDVSPAQAALVAAGVAPMRSREEVETGLRPADVPTPEATAEAEALRPIPDRDRAWLGIEAHFGRGEELHDDAAQFLAIARNCEQDQRAVAPWFLYAWATWRMGDCIRTNIAIQHALDLDPGYSPARLLTEALHAGIDPREAPALTEV